MGFTGVLSIVHQTSNNDHPSEVWALGVQTAYAAKSPDVAQNAMSATNCKTCNTPLNEL